MEAPQEILLDTLWRVQHYLDDNGAALPAVNASGSRKSLDAMIVELGVHAAEQDAHRRVAEAATQRRLVARRTLLRREMRAVANVGEVEFPQTPEFQAFKAPPSKSSAQQLVAAAQAMATLAKPHAQVFLDAGLPATFIEDLLTAARAFVDARGTGTDARAKRVGSTKGLKTVGKRARRVLHVLDSLVERALEGESSAPLLAQWRSARRIPRSQGGRRTPPPDGPDEAAAA